MTANTIHTCSYYCERPGCVRAQRDELWERLEAALAQQPAAVDGPDAQVAEIEALRAEVERLKSMTDVTMGIGSGDGNLFVHGDYESIKAAQAVVLERDALRAGIEELAAVLVNEWKRVTAAQGEAKARAERLAEALRESHGEVLRLRAAMFRVYATAANGGDPTMYIEQMRDEMDKPWSGDKASAALEQEAGR